LRVHENVLDAEVADRGVLFVVGAFLVLQQIANATGIGS